MGKTEIATSGLGRQKTVLTRSKRKGCNRDTAKKDRAVGVERKTQASFRIEL